MAKEIDLDELKKIVKEGAEDEKKAKPAPEKKKVEEKMREIKTVEDIVEIMKEKYEKEGRYIRDDLSREDRVIEQFVTPTLRISGSPEDLEKWEHPFIRTLGKLYMRMRGIVDAIVNRFFTEKVVKKLDWTLYAANLPFSGKQYVVLTTVIALLAGVLGFFVGIVAGLRYGVAGVALPPAFFLLFFIVAFAIAMMYPRNAAGARSRAAEKQLPYALRHLAVEIRAGMGLYQAIQAVARGGYGVLSEEFERTLKEIDEGSTTELALANLAARMQSKGIKRAVAQIVRALKIGGSLSDVIMDLAKEISFEQRMRVVAYAEKLNVLGIAFMFMAVVFPVMLSVLSAIGHSPSGSAFLKAFALDLNLLFIIYVILFPSLLLMMLYFVKISDPMR